MLLEREENSILTAIHPKLSDFIKTTNLEKHTEANRRLENGHTEAKEDYNAQPFEEYSQKYYQENLQTAGYSQIPTIHRWKNYRCKPACALYPHIYVTSDFLILPLEECLGILAHENEHIKNFHTYKRFNIYSFLEEQNIPITHAHYTYSQCIEKEADLKAGAYGIAIAKGLLASLKRLEKEEGLENPCQPSEKRTHPLTNERINYTQDLIAKLEQEQKGYAWNPFYKTLGLTEWFKRC